MIQLTASYDKLTDIDMIFINNMCMKFVYMEYMTYIHIILLRIFDKLYPY